MVEKKEDLPTEKSEISRRHFFSKAKKWLVPAIAGATISLIGNGIALVAFRKPLSEEKIREIEQKIYSEYASWREDTLPNRPEIFKNLQIMSQKAGLGKSKLIVYESSDINAQCIPNLSIFLSEYGTRVSISSEMLKILDDKEIISVLAHELGHISNEKKNYGRVVMTQGAVVALGLTAFMGTEAVTKKLFPERNEDVKKRGVFSRRKALNLGIMSASVVAANKTVDFFTATTYPVQSPPADHIQEYDADFAGVHLSGDKDAMISAFRKMEKWDLDHYGFVYDGSGTHPTFPNRIDYISR